jgi:hypothetical protein
LKGLEYGLLGTILGGLGKRSAGAWGHAAAGAAVGAVFATAIAAATYRAAPQPPPLANLISQWLNEFLFPIGCSLVIFFSQAFGRETAS